MEWTIVIVSVAGFAALVAQNAIHAWLVESLPIGTEIELSDDDQVGNTRNVTSSVSDDDRVSVGQ